MKIGELAQKTGMQVETVRYYEKEGLLPRTAAPTAIIAFIAMPMSNACSSPGHCRSLDMTLDEIRILLHFKDIPDESCDRSMLFWTSISAMWLNGSGT